MDLFQNKVTSNGRRVWRERELLDGACDISVSNVRSWGPNSLLGLDPRALSQRSIIACQKKSDPVWTWTAASCPLPLKQRCQSEMRSTCHVPRAFVIGFCCRCLIWESAWASYKNLHSTDLYHTALSSHTRSPTTRPSLYQASPTVGPLPIAHCFLHCCSCSGLLHPRSFITGLIRFICSGWTHVIIEGGHIIHGVNLASSFSTCRPVKIQAVVTLSEASCYLLLPALITPEPLFTSYRIVRNKHEQPVC